MNYKLYFDSFVFLKSIKVNDIIYIVGGNKYYLNGNEIFLKNQISEKGKDICYLICEKENNTLIIKDIKIKCGEEYISYFKEKWDLEEKLFYMYFSRKKQIFKDKEGLKLKIKEMINEELMSCPDKIDLEELDEEIKEMDIKLIKSKKYTSYRGNSCIWCHEYEVISSVNSYSEILEENDIKDFLKKYIKSTEQDLIDDIEVIKRRIDTMTNTFTYLETTKIEKLLHKLMEIKEIINED